VQANFVTPAVLNNYGYALLKTKRLVMARRILEDAARLAPQEGPIRHNLGVLEIAERRYDEAIRQIRLALECEPNASAELHWNAAIAYAEASAATPEYEDLAVEHLEAAIRAGIDQDTLGKGPGALQKAWQIVAEKNVRCVPASRAEISGSRLMQPAL
jgi:tetratricopeptide (TPR) repeat protein